MRLLTDDESILLSSNNESSDTELEDSLEAFLSEEEQLLKSKSTKSNFKVHKSF